MTFRIGSHFPRQAMAAALLASVWSCSSRAPESPAGAAPARSDSGTSSGSGHPAPAASTPTAATTSDHPDGPAAEPAAAPGPVAAAADSQFVKWDPASKTVTFRLVAGPFAFNGFTSGGGTLTVPPGSINTWNFVQDDGTPHSAEVAAGTGPLPNSGGNPAIPRAYTNKVVEGLVQGATDVIAFTAPDSGTYRIICGVPGHALSGMWLWFKVDPSAKAPSFGATPK
ncbi:MAG: sulfocyanin-like copper-binding protein [Gemmatimonadales bacterium]